MQNLVDQAKEFGTLSLKRAQAIYNQLAPAMQNSEAYVRSQLISTITAVLFSSVTLKEGIDYGFTIIIEGFPLLQPFCCF